MKRIDHLLWTLLYLALFTFIFLSAARSQTAQTETVLERVIPRGCMLSVQLDDPSKCHVEAIELTLDSECRGPIGEPLLCSKFSIRLNKECRYTVTKRADCEITNVKKVPARVGNSE